MLYTDLGIDILKGVFDSHVRPEIERTLEKSIEKNISE